MLHSRWLELDIGVGYPGLTKEERDEGWHFCDDWDLLLIGPDMPEWEACTCNKRCEFMDQS